MARDVCVTMDLSAHEDARLIGLPAMDVVSAPPLRASSILWQGTTRVLTVVCKVTFALTPGETGAAALRSLLAVVNDGCQADGNKFTIVGLTTAGASTFTYGGAEIGRAHV